MKKFIIRQVCTYTIQVEADDMVDAVEIASDVETRDWHQDWADFVVTEITEFDNEIPTF